MARLLKMRTHMEEFIAFLEVKSLPFHLHNRS